MRPAERAARTDRRRNNPPRRPAPANPKTQIIRMPAMKEQGAPQPSGSAWSGRKSGSITNSDTSIKSSMSAHRGCGHFRPPRRFRKTATPPAPRKAGLGGFPTPGCLTPISVIQRREPLDLRPDQQRRQRSGAIEIVNTIRRGAAKILARREERTPRSGTMKEGSRKTARWRLKK